MDIKSYFGRKQDALIGLDISSWGIKVVALSGSMDSPAVETMDSVYLPPGCLVEGNIVKMAEVVQALQSLLQKNKIKAKKAAFALDQIATVDQGYPAAYRAARACDSRFTLIYATSEPCRVSLLALRRRMALMTAPLTS